VLNFNVFSLFSCPAAEWIDGIPKEGAVDRVIVIAPDAEIYYPACTHEDGRGSGATFHPIFITKSKNSQKYNSHLQFFALCHLLAPDCVFLTDAGTVYNNNCVNKLTEYLLENKHEVAGVTARQRVMGENLIREVQEYPSWWKDEQGRAVHYDKKGIFYVYSILSFIQVNPILIIV
jgi:hypothetical protein